MSPTTDKPKSPKRRWLSFGIRSLMLLVLAISLPMGLIGRDLYRYRVEQDIVLKIEAAGGRVDTSRFGINPFEEDFSGNPDYSLRQSLLVKVFGEGFYRRPYAAQIDLHDVDPILEHLSKLETLQILTFDHSAFTGDSNEHISKFRNLMYISFGEVKIEAQQLRQFALSPKLTDLTLQHMNLSDAHCETLKESGTLKRLSLFDVSISNQGFEHLSKARSLTSLIITVPDEITEDGLYLLGNHRGLEELVLTHAPIDDQCLEAFSQIPTLRKLHIVGSPEDITISEQGLDHLASLPNLEVLHLDFIPLVDEELASIGRLRQLKDFQCLGTHVTDKGFEHLLQLEHLESLCIQEAQPSMEAMRSLARSRSIRTVDLGNGLECSFPEYASGNYGMPYADNRADYDQNRRGKVTRSVFCLVGEIPPPFPNIPSVEDPSTTPIELPNNFADTINDPFLPPSEELAIE